MVSEKSGVVVFIGNIIKNNRNPNFLKYGWVWYSNDVIKVHSLHLHVCSAFLSVVSIFREVPLMVTSLPSAATGADFDLFNKSSIKRWFLFPLIKTKELQIWVSLALTRLACLTWLYWSNYCAQDYLIWLARTKLWTNSGADGEDERGQVIPHLKYGWCWWKKAGINATKSKQWKFNIAGNIIINFKSEFFIIFKP